MRLVWTMAALAGTVALADHVPSGPAVGAKIPAFEAPDQYGKPQSLATLAGLKGVMLVFFRSADW